MYRLDFHSHSSQLTEVPKGYAIGCVFCGNVHNKCKHNWGVVIDVECYICDTEGDHLTLECSKIEAQFIAKIDARAREVAEAEKGKEGAAKDRARAEAEANGTLECLLCHEKGDHLYWECPRLITAGLTKVNSEGGCQRERWKAEDRTSTETSLGVLGHLRVWSCLILDFILYVFYSHSKLRHDELLFNVGMLI